VEFHPSGCCRVMNKCCSNDDHGNTSNSDDFCDILPVVAMGHWTKHPWGVIISLQPLQWATTNATTTDEQDDNDDFASNQQQRLVQYSSQQHEILMYASAFHWNPFGRQPKLTQGTILLQPRQHQNDNSNERSKATPWFRPVMGTFTAVGTEIADETVQQ